MFSHLHNIEPFWRLKRGVIIFKLCDAIVIVPNVGCLLYFVSTVNVIAKKLGFELHQQYNETTFHVVNKFKRRLLLAHLSEMKQPYTYAIF